MISPRFRFLFRALKARLRDQRCELRELLSEIAPGDTAVDVGANKGAYLPWMSRAAREGSVVAFEPQPRLAEYLKNACALTGLRNVKIESAGVSKKGGRMHLQIPGMGDSPGASFESAVGNREACRSVEVAVVSLDEYFRNCERRIAAIKVDVEGHELAVFQGAESILKKHSPLLVFECEGRHMTDGNVQDVLRYLGRLDYTGSFVWRSKLFAIEEFDPNVHQRRGGNRFWDHPDYCNNFVMRRSEAPAIC